MIPDRAFDSYFDSVIYRDPKAAICHLWFEPQKKDFNNIPENGRRNFGPGTRIPDDQFEADKVGKAHEGSSQKDRRKITNLPSLNPLLEALDVTLGHFSVVPEAHLAVDHLAFRHHPIDLPMLPEEFIKSQHSHSFCIPPIPGPGHGALQFPAHLVIDIFHEPLDQISLAAEVHVEGPLGYTGRAGDLGDVGAIDPMLAEDSFGRAEDGLPGIFAFGQGLPLRRVKGNRIGDGKQTPLGRLFPGGRSIDSL